MNIHECAFCGGYFFYDKVEDPEIYICPTCRKKKPKEMMEKEK